MQQIIISSESDSDQRIDKFLKKFLTEAPLGWIYKWLRTGKIKVNRKKVDGTYRVELEDIIDIHLTDEEISGFQKTESVEKQKDEKKKENIKLDILYEDEGFLVVNKPASMSVHPGDHKSTEASLIEIVQDFLGKKYDSLSFKPSLVHRIDRDTSGALLIAKEKKVLDTLLSTLQSWKIEKIYHAVVVGKPPKPRGTIDKKLKRLENAQDEAKVQVSEDGQEAITHYKTLEENIHGKYTLLELAIETGRTHQIRVHLASIDCPILGDKAYGNKSENSFIKRSFWIERQLLHAYSLAFPHPKTGEKMMIKAPYKIDMEKFIHSNL